MFKKRRRIDEFINFANVLMRAWERYDKQFKFGDIITSQEEIFEDFKKKK